MRDNNASINRTFYPNDDNICIYIYICVYTYVVFIFSSGKENLSPMLSTPRHSFDSSTEQTLSGIFIIFVRFYFISNDKTKDVILSKVLLFFFLSVVQFLLITN